jgi:hypothetical protein
VKSDPVVPDAYGRVGERPEQRFRPSRQWSSPQWSAPQRLSRQRLSRQWPLLVLSGWAAVWFRVLAPAGGIAWHFFVEGSRLAFSGPYPPHYRGAGGLHLYANYPWLQIGPLSFAVAQVLRHLGPDNGLVTAELVMTVMGLGVLIVVRHVAVAVRPDLAAGRSLRWGFLAGGAIFMIGWEELAVAYGHLDDALALLCAVLALRAAISRRPVLVGLTVGLAADAKPWALVFLPLLLVAGLPGDEPSGEGAARRARVTSGWVLSGRVLSGWVLSGWVLSGAVALGIVAAAWLPFYLGDPGTSAAAHYAIANLPDSALRALGVSTAHTPSWDRAAQVAVGCALGALAVWRRRWPAVILLGVGARIALDPAVHGYYTAGVLLGALIWDLLGARRPVPFWTLVSYAALDLVPLLTHDPAVRGAFRLYVVVAFTLAILLGPASWYAPTVSAGR